MEVSLWIVAGGMVIGLLYGLFGIGSALASPVLSLLGVPGIVAIAAPLPALLPGSAAGAWTYWRRGTVDWWLARRTLVAAVPFAVVGSVLSGRLGGPVLLAVSAVAMLGVGLRILWPPRGQAADQRGQFAAAGERSRGDSLCISVLAAGVGFAAGVLANGGGFLLVPLFLLVVGLDQREATGTSMVVVTALTVPTLVTHARMGDVDWLVAVPFAVGLVPGAYLGARLGQRMATHRLRILFGWLLVVFAVWFLVRQALTPG